MPILRSVGLRYGGAVAAPTGGPDGTQNYVTVTIAASQVGSTLTDFPAYVRMSDLPTTFWSKVQADGGDIRVTQSNGTTRCPVDLVSIDTGTSTGELHFGTSSVSSSTDTVFRIYYNATSTISQPAVTDTYGRNAVWSDYAAVYHGDDTTDSTGNGNTLTANGDAATGYTTDSKIGDAFNLDGAGDYLQAADSTSLRIGGDFSVSAWARRTGTVTTSAAIVAKNDIDGNWEWWLVTDHDNAQGDVNVAFSEDGTTTNWSRVVGGALSASAWHLIRTSVDVSAADAGIDIFVDGSGVSETTGSSTATSLYDSTSPLTIGNILNAGSPYTFDFAGQIDEVRVRAGLTTAAWDASEHTNQNTPTTFYTIGSEQTA